MSSSVVLYVLAGLLLVPVIVGAVLIVVVRRRMTKPGASPAQMAAPVAGGGTICSSARQEAAKHYHGQVAGLPANLHPIARHFMLSQDRLQGGWSPAFVYHCLCVAGRAPGVDEGDFLTTDGWMRWAERAGCLLRPMDQGFLPVEGDILVFTPFGDAPRHMGIVVELRQEDFLCAEGDLGGVSAVVARPLDKDIQAIIRLPKA